jgi:hypothetical protein
MELIRRPVHPRIQRRRALAASLHIPPELSAKFTEGEMAVLKVVAHVRHSACTLTRDTIADLSGTGRGTVKTALRTAKAEGLIEVRQGSRYNLSTQWMAWLDRRGDAPPNPS